ncbi:MAG: M20/M25/M40 family metallo-hydrolase [Arachnia sp.]
MIPRLLPTFGVAVASLVGLAWWRAERHRRSTPAPPVPSSNPAPVPGAHHLAERLARLVAFPTIVGDDAAFRGLHAELTRLYPEVFERLEIEPIGPRGLGMMCRWPGADPATAAAPLVLMAHQDVVPVAGQGWSSDPFEASLRDGQLFGRGTLDDKGSLLLLFEAIDVLIGQGFEPTREVYLLLGDCEEVGGPSIADAARLLAERGIRPWLVLDEGGAVVEAGSLPGLTSPAAMIGVAEKGELSARLTANDPGGHASTPHSGGAPGRLASAISTLDRQPFPVELPVPVLQMLRTLGQVSTPATSLLYSNSDLLAGPCARILAWAGEETAAMVRTTAAVTQLSGSPAPNVLATSASAVVNLRVPTGVSTATVLDQLRRFIHDDAISVEILSRDEASRVSPSTGAGWDALRRALHTSYPEAVALPYLQTGATDARHLSSICDQVYRFSPLRMSLDQRARLHAADEAISIDTLQPGVQFIVSLIEDVCG